MLHVHGHFVLIGINEYLNRFEDATAVGIRKVLVDRLVDLFDRVAVPGWIWFEESLTYDNAKLAHALIVNGRSMDDRVVFEKGIQALRWLVEVQTTQHGQLRPIGNNGFYVHNGSRAIFDQQPNRSTINGLSCLSRIQDYGRSVVVRASRVCILLVSWQQRPGHSIVRLPDWRL